MPFLLLRGNVPLYRFQPNRPLVKVLQKPVVILPAVHNGRHTARGRGKPVIIYKGVLLTSQYPYNGIYIMVNITFIDRGGGEEGCLVNKESTRERYVQVVFEVIRQ